MTAATTHNSLTPHRRLNKWLGRIAFLPSLTAYSVWDVGHNMVQHGGTNLVSERSEFARRPHRCVLQMVARRASDS